MKISELYPEVLSEDMEYEYKATLNPDNPIKWAKTIVGYANGKGGIMFVGVSNSGDAFGIDWDEINKTKLLISRILSHYRAESGFRVEKSDGGTY